MSIIGIITNSNNIIELQNKNNLILINDKTIENMKNIKFDVIVIYEEIKQNEKVKKLINNSKYLIVSTDFKNNKELINEKLEGIVLTFGFYSKSSIRIVSNENEEIILEIQREIKNLKGEKIECQEIKLNNNYGKNHIYLAIAMKILEILGKI